MDASAILESIAVVDFEEERWVDAAVEWKRLPQALRSSSEKWTERFSKLKMPTSTCRYTKFKKINEPLDRSYPCKKSVFVPLDLWKSTIRDAVAKANKKRKSSALAQPEPQPQDHGEEPHCHAEHDDEPTEATILQLEEISIGVSESFVHEGRLFHVRAYGERKPDLFFLNLSDVLNAIAVRHEKVPDAIDVQYASVGNETVKVLSFDMLITLICLKAKKFPVAASLKRWVVHVAFHAQYGDKKQIEPQAAFAHREGKFTRQMYGLTEPGREVLYMLEVCSGTRAMELFPTQVAAALPQGVEVENCFVCKPGFTLDEKDRIGSNRTKLKKIFPGCDPRPIHSAEFPGISAKDLQNIETKVFVQEFESQRIEGIFLHNEEQTELYLFESIDAQTAKNSMNLYSHRHIRSHVAAAKEMAQKHEVEKIKMEQRIADLKQAAEQREDVLKQAAEQREEALKHELASTRKAALQIMPPDTAKIFSSFWGVA